MSRQDSENNSSIDAAFRIDPWTKLIALSSAPAWWDLSLHANWRWQIGAPGVETDFLIQGPAMHGIAGLVNLFGIESPGLIASMAIARELKALLLMGWAR